MKKITSYQIALSAIASAFATLCLVVGVYTEILLFTGYLLAGVALMLPLSKGSFVGCVFAYFTTTLLALLFVSWRFWDVLPFAIFFGLHPIVNELQLRLKINRWVACAIKAVWFDITLFLTWKFVFGMTSSISVLDPYMVWIIALFGTVFFVFYDNLAYRCRAMVNRTVARIERKK